METFEGGTRYTTLAAVTSGFWPGVLQAACAHTYLAIAVLSLGAYQNKLRDAV